MKIKNIFYLVIAFVLLGCEKEGNNHPFYEAKSSFQVSVNMVFLDSCFQFINRSDSVNVTYNWDFGDGTNSTKRHPYHCYKNSGNYKVALTTLVNDIPTDSTIKDIKVIIGERYFDLLNITRGYDFAECLDSSFLVLGDSRNNQEYRRFISKFDKNLKKILVRTLNYDPNQPFGNIERLSDGNFIISGSFDNSDNEGHFALTKTTSRGNVIWNKRYPQTDGYCRFATESKDGGIISIGSENYIVSPYGNKAEIVTVLKTDANGNFEWKKQFVDDWLLDAKNILALDDGFVFASSTVNDGPYLDSHDSLVLMKIGFNGELIWKETKEWQIPDSSVSYRVWASSVAKNSNNFVVVNEGNKLVMVFDLHGNFIKRNYTDIISNRVITSTISNKFVIAGGEPSWWEININGFDEIVENRWSKNLGRRKKAYELYDGYGAMVKTLLDGNLLFLGTCYKDNVDHNESSMLLVKINEEGEIQ